MKEKREFRKECVKHFENADHTFTAAVYGQPVHYMKNGEWKDIDNSIVLNQEGRYENKGNDFQVSFAKEASDEKLITVSKDGHGLEWKLLNSLPAPIFMKKNKSKAKNMEVANLKSKVTYKNVRNGMDLEYILSSKDLKENIILSRPLEDGCLTFEIKTDLEPIKKDNKIIFVTEGKESVFTMAAPYMFDADGQMSYGIDIQCHLMEEEGKILYMIIPDREWLNASERKWPVTIDPIISSSTDYEKISDTRICSKYPNDNFGENMELIAGKSTSVGTARSLIDFELPVLKPADMVIKAIFNVTCFSDYRVSHQIHLHRILDSWNCYKVTWNTMPRYDSKIIDCNIFTDEVGKSVQFDITELVKDWYNNGNKHGVMLKDSDEAGAYVEFLATDTSEAYMALRPKVFIQYVNYTGIQDLWTYHSQDVRRAGQVFVNDYNGNLIYKHAIDTISGNRMPYTLELVYNTNDMDLDIGYGKGMRLNYHQQIGLKTIDGTQYYEWIDGTGTRHYFKHDSDTSKWLDELNQDIELTIGTSVAEKYVISNKSEDKLIFNSGGLLVKIKDINDNALTITYENNCIKTITDGAGRILSVGFSGNKIMTVTNTEGHEKTFAIFNGYLVGIQDFDAKELSLEYTNGLLTSVENFDGYRMVYTYTGNPTRVETVKEYVGGDSKRTLTVEYGCNINKFTDERGRAESYLFNHAGQTVSIKNDEGYAQVQEYLEEGAAVNKLSKVSKLQYTAPQLLKNPNVFDEAMWTGYALNGSSATLNTDTAYTRQGNMSLKLESANTTSYGRYGQYISLTKGKTYTFSAYVRTANEISYGSDAGTYLRVEYKDSAGNYQGVESRRVKNTYGEWTLLDVTFTLPFDSASTDVIFYVIQLHFRGISYVDCLQVEEGKVGNRRNLVENNDFTYDLYKFTRSSTLEDRDKLLDISEIAEDSSGDSENNVLSGTVNADVLNVRSGPGTNYSAITQISNGQMVTVLETTTGSGMTWYYIRFALNGATYTGYVAAEYITLLSADVRTGTVNADILNMRTGPGTGYTAIAQLTYGTGVTILANTSGDGMQWFQISVLINGTEYTGYVAAEYITETTASGNGNGPVNTEEIPQNTGALNSKVMRMVGNPTAEKRLSQTIPVSGKANDSYVISGWGCGNPLPKNDSRAFGVELEFSYTDGSKEAFVENFASDSNQWQYVNKVVIAKKDYTTIKASYLLKNNANKVYFDGLSVYKDEYWPSFTYDDKGNVVSCTDARNKKTTFAYDEKNNITKITTPKGADFKYVYDSKHNITEATTATNKKYKFTYDNYGNVTSVRLVNPNNENQYIQSDMTYTSDGNYLSKNTDCFGKTVVYEYGTVNGNLKSMTDVNGKKTSYAYDMMGRLTSVSRTNKVNGTDTTIANNYTYENDRLKTISHNGMNYIFNYDSFGNLAQARVGSRTLVTNTYKMNGSQLNKSVLGNNTGVSYEYDQYDRVVREKSVKSDGTVVTEFEYLYDHDGNLVGVEDKVNNEKQHYFYSISNQLARTESSTGASVQYMYDENDTLKAVRSTYNDVSKQMSYEYDADYKETKTITMGGKNLISEYDALGRVTTQRFNTDNLFTVTYGYRDGANGSSSAMIQSLSNNGRSTSYLYYDDGNIRQIQTPWTTQTFEYDDIGQLIRVNDDDTGFTTVYSYDAGGNMTSERVYAYTTAAVPTTELLSQRTFTYDAEWKDQMLTCGGKALTYDGVGNLLSYDGVTFNWTRGRRLSGVTKADGTKVAYTYNHSGQRVSKTIGGVKHTYFYSGNLLMCEKASGLDMRFSYNSVGNPVSILYNNVEYYYVKNLQGDIIGLIDAAGTWVVEYSYDVWGNIRSVFGTMASTLGQDNPIRYRGYYYDTETKLYYVSSRYYSPELCRFISSDDVEPFVKFHENSVQYNLYAYCWNNPVNMFDRDGEWPEWVKKAVAVVAVAAVVVAATVVTVATFGAGSIAGVAAITATATFAARATEVAVLQARKSRAEGLDTKKIATNVAEAIYDNGAPIIGKTPGTKMISIGVHHGLNVQIEEIFGGKASFSGTLKSSGGKVVPYGFVAYNWAHVLYSLFCRNPMARAKKRRYSLR